MKCFICGHTENVHAKDGLHEFLSYADVENHFQTMPAADYSPESAYVAEHRPY